MGYKEPYKREQSLQRKESRKYKVNKIRPIKRLDMYDMQNYHSKSLRMNLKKQGREILSTFG